MQSDPTGDSEESHEGLGLVDVLPESLRFAVIIVDEQRNISTLNPEAEKMLGRPADQLLNRSLDSLPPLLREAILETFSTAQPQTRQLLLHTKDRGEVAVHVSTSVARFPIIEAGGVIAVLNDLSAARNLETSMRRLDRLASIGTLSASMAHEIKNALVAVRTFIDLLIQKNKDAELSQIVSREVRRIDSIVSQMLRFAGPAKPTFAPVRLHEVLEQSLRLVEHQLAARKIRLKKSFAAAPDAVRGDSYQLEQALLNLFFNAIEAMGPNGELSIATDNITPVLENANLTEGAQCPHVRLRIKDSGMGIPPENIARLFDTFFTTKKKGNGLGLTITRRIIKEHSGNITVESELNRGTTFTILLPCAG